MILFCQDLQNLLLILAFLYNIVYWFLFVFQGNKLKSFDSQPFPISRFITALHQNKSLSGRPKVLILECCRGKEWMTGRVKSPIDWPDDFYVLNSTSSGYISATDHKQGSPFVRIFGESLMKNFLLMSLQDIFQEVKEKVSNIKTGVLHPDEGGSVYTMQIPEECSTLKKQLYLCKFPRKKISLCSKQKLLLNNFFTISNKLIVLYNKKMHVIGFKSCT
jgi:hypothetical protein